MYVAIVVVGHLVANLGTLSDKLHGQAIDGRSANYYASYFSKPNWYIFLCIKINFYQVNLNRNRSQSTSGILPCERENTLSKTILRLILAKWEISPTRSSTQTHIMPPGDSYVLRTLLSFSTWGSDEI